MKMKHETRIQFDFGYHISWPATVQSRRASTTMKRTKTDEPLVVSVESPYNNADPKLLKRNINYAIMAVKDSTRNYGNAAYASHLLNTQYVEGGEHCYLSDDVDDKFDLSREQVIAITHALRKKADKIVFYVDFGYSGGMLAAKDLASRYGIPIEERTLPKEMLDEVHVK